MTTLHSMESTTTRKIVWAAVILLAAAVAACGGSTQGITGTAPSLVSPVAGADGAGTFNLLKEGKGKNGHSPAPDAGTPPTDGTTPDPDDPEGDTDEFGNGRGHGKAAIQIEGFTKSITGECNEVTIVMDDDIPTTVQTHNLVTEFQRAECIALKTAGETTPVHVHIAARMEDTTLVAIYVRMQGPKGDDGDE
jgi:hypothetical protein